MNQRDIHHGQIVDVMNSESLLILPAAILAEATFMISQRFGERRVVGFLESLIDGDLTLHWDAMDLHRVQELVVRYSDMPLGFADASVIACAERRGGKVLTLDYRHFGVVVRKGTIQVLP